MDLTIYWC